MCTTLTVSERRFLGGIGMVFGREKEVLPFAVNPRWQEQEAGEAAGLRQSQNSQQCLCQMAFQLLPNLGSLIVVVPGLWKCCQMYVDDNILAWISGLCVSGFFFGAWERLRIIPAGVQH